MLPVVARELRVIARRRGTYLTRVGASSLAMLTMLWLLVIAAAGSPVAGQGKVLFETLSTFAFVFALVVGVRITADCLSSEKREGTLGLLFLTDLKGYDLVFGKLASSSLASLYSLLAVVPVLALGLLLGGVSLLQVFRVALVLLNTMFFSLSVGIFVSTLSYNERKAMFAAFVLIAFLTLFPVIVIVFCGEMLEMKLSDQTEAFIMMPSPLLTFMFAFANGPWSRPPIPFLVPMVIVHLVSWILLAGASRLLTRVSHDRPKSARRENWSKILRNWSYGTGEARLRFRRAMLDRNAFSWLAARDRLKPHYVWFFLGVLAALWGWGAWKYPAFFSDWEIAPVMLFLVHGFVKLWFASEVCNRLVEDRRAGALELLLSSPLGVEDIARGQGLALRRQFFWPVLALLALDCAIMLASPDRVSGYLQGIFMMFPAGMSVLILDLFTLKWVGMWLAASQNNLSRVLLGTLWRVLLLPWLIWFLLFSSVAFFQFVFGKPIEVSALQMVGVWTLISVVTDLIFGLTARKRFLRDFRRLATPGTPPIARPIVSWREAFKRKVRSQQERVGQPILWKAFLRRHWIATSIAALLLLSLVSLTIYRLKLSAKVKRELQTIQKRGEPVLGPDLDKWHPVVLENENAAAQLRPALAKLVMPGATVATNHAERQAIVERNAKTLQIAHQAVLLPKSRFNFDWNDPQLGTGWQFWRVFQLSQLLRIQARVQVDDGDPAAALESIKTIFGLAHILANEPWLDAQARRLFLLNQALYDCERLLSQASWTDGQLRQFQEILAGAERESLGSNHWARALITERFRLIQFHEALSLGLAPFGRGQLPGSELTRLQLLFGVQRLTGAWDRNLLRSLKTMETNIEAAKLPLPERLLRVGNLEAQSGGQMFIQMGGIVQGVMPLLGPATVRDDADIIARLRGAQTAVAIERFHLQNGSIPGELVQLVPAFLQNVPADPLDGQPLKYIGDEKKYLIYAPRNPLPNESRAANAPNRISAKFTVNKRDEGVR